MLVTIEAPTVAFRTQQIRASTLGILVSGWIQNVDPPKGPIIYAKGMVESRIGGSISYSTILCYTIVYCPELEGSTFWILPGVWARARVRLLCNKHLYPSPCVT